MKLSWRFYLGVWLGIRLALDYATYANGIEKLEREVLERLEIELIDELGFNRKFCKREK